MQISMWKVRMTFSFSFSTFGHGNCKSWYEINLLMMCLEYKLWLFSFFLSAQCSRTGSCDHKYYFFLFSTNFGLSSLSFFSSALGHGLLLVYIYIYNISSFTANGFKNEPSRSEYLLKKKVFYWSTIYYF
mgnify:CR=1 FL=1